MLLNEIRNLPQEKLLELLVSCTNELLAAKSQKMSGKDIHAKKKELETIQLVISNKKIIVSTN
jgi:hypothetical protein